MIDASLIAVIVAIAVIIAVFCIFLLRSAKERTYEEVYGEKNLTALLSEKSRKAGKVKQPKQKKEKGVTVEKEPSESGGSISSEVKERTVVKRSSKISHESVSNQSVKEETPEPELVQVNTIEVQAKKPVVAKVFETKQQSSGEPWEAQLFAVFTNNDIPVTVQTAIHKTITQYTLQKTRTDSKQAADLSKQLSSAKSRADAAEDQKHKLEKRIEHLQTSLDADRQRLTKQSTEAEQKMLDIQRQLVAAVARMDDEKQKASNAEQELNTVRSMLTSQAQKQANDQNKYRQTMAVNETERLKLAADHQSLKEQLAKLHNTSKPAVLQAAPPPVKDLSAELANANSRLKQAETKLAAERQAAHDVQVSFDKISEMCQRLRMERDENEKRAESANNQMHELQMKHENEMKQQSEMIQPVEIKQQNVKSLHTAVANGDMVNGNIPKAIDDTKFVEKITALQTDVSDLTQKLATRSVEVARLKETCDQNGEYANKYAKLQAEFETLKKTSTATLCKTESTLREQLDTALSELAAFKQQSLKANAPDSDAAKKLFTAETELAKYKQQVEQLETTVKRSGDQDKDLTKQLKSTEADLSKYKKIVEQLQTDVKTATNKDTNLNAQLKAAQNELATCKQQIENVAKAKSSEDSDAVKQLKTEVGRLTSELAALKTSHDGELARVTKETAKLTEQLADKRKEVETLQTTERDTFVTEVIEVEGGDGNADLQAQIDEYKKKNDELRSRNYAAVEAVCEVEKQMARLLQQGSNADNNIYAHVQSLAQSIAPNLKVPAPSSKTAVWKEWISNIETVVKAQSSTTPPATINKVVLTEQKSAVNPNDAQVAELKADIAKYQQTLATLADTLTAVEDSAREELAKWQSMCTQLELRLLNSNVQEASNHHTENTVVIKEKEGVSEKQYNEVRQQLADLQKKLLLDDKENNSLREQLAVLTETLATERTTGRDLSQQAVKLRGMLKVGQEALRHEQSTVSTLREQLSVYQQSS